jgi:peptidyl-prolyl cis-trans isomerase SurA
MTVFLAMKNKLMMNHTLIKNFFCATLLILSTYGQAADVTPLDKTVAIVEDDVIMASDLQQEVARLQAQQKEQAPDPQRLQKQALEKLIMDSIQLQLAEKLDIHVTEDDVNNMMQTIAKQHNMTVDQLKQALAAQGDNVESFREQLRKERTIGQLRQRQIGPRVQVTKQEIAQFLKSPNKDKLKQMNPQAAEVPTVVSEAHVRHILITPSAIRTDAQAEKLANDIKQQLDRGGDFATLARKYSNDVGSVSEGGDLGWVTAEQLDPDFAAMVGKTPAHKVSAPFKTQFGWHILEVLDTRTQDKAADQQTEQARNYLRNQKFNAELQNWLRQIRQEAYVDIKL